jgi:hypothetical protein
MRKVSYSIPSFLFWSVVLSGLIAMSILGTISFASLQEVNCQRNMEAIISKFVFTLSLRNSSGLPQVVTNDIYFDITQAGGPGPIIGLSNLTVLFDLLQVIIRSETAIIGNPQFNGCNPSIIVNLLGTQAMDQIFSPGDTTLPSISTGAFVSMTFNSGKVSSFIMLPNLTQVAISQQFSGVLIPPVKRFSRSADRDRWNMLLAYIAQANHMGLTPLVTYLQNTHEYVRLHAIFG